MEKKETPSYLRRKPEKESFQKFLWNSEKKEFCGRTGTSWAKIGVFYLIYYACLALFFAALMAVFYQTLDTENAPKYSYGESILKNPALGFRPRPPKKNIESTLIWYSSSDAKTSKHWIDELNNFVTNHTGQSTRKCRRNNKPKKLTDAQKKTPCQVEDIFSERRWPGFYCNSEDKWGYDKNSPCIILKLNKMVGWEPDCYRNVSDLPTSMPVNLKNAIKKLSDNTTKIPPMAWVSCEGEYPSDKEHLPNVDMKPHPGFLADYFPYSKNPSYRSPLIAIQFTNITKRVLVNIECKIWAKNVEHNRQNRLGIVHFEILSD